MNDTTAIVLWAISSADEPLWKRRLTRLLNNEEPYKHLLEDGISPQTVGRHVDRLRENNLVEAQPASIDAAPRHLIVIYNPTDEATNHISEWRDQKIRDIILAHGEHLLQKNVTPIPDKTRPFLTALVQEEFNIAEEEWETLEATTEGEELHTGLLSAVTMHYFHKYLSPHLEAHPVVDTLASTSDEYAQHICRDLLTDAATVETPDTDPT